jgi:FkbM family methyltransferase
VNAFIDNTVARSIIWRLGRKLYSWARRDLPQEPSVNGEYWLLKKIICSSSFSKPIYIDIGSHLGSWSSYAQTLIRMSGTKPLGHIYAFEPATDSYAALSEKFKSSEIISLNKLALSDQSGIRNFFICGTKVGINSLSETGDAIGIEQIYSQRLDNFLAQRQIEQVVFVKSDAEGHDFNIICGATDMLEQGRVEIWQFEYNHRWLAEKRHLKDVFEFIADKPYRLGKLYNNGIEIYDNWHPELERFFEANYVLIKRGSEFESLCKTVRFNRNNVLV